MPCPASSRCGTVHPLLASLASCCPHDEASGSAGQGAQGSSGCATASGQAGWRYPVRVGAGAGISPGIIENVVEQIDTIVRPVRRSGWQTSQPGDPEVRVQLRLVLKINGLPPQGTLFDRAYAYVKEHY